MYPSNKNYIWTGDRNTFLSGAELAHPDNFPGIGQVAKSLSHTNRYNGHTVRPISVAEHSLLCVNIARILYEDTLEQKDLIQLYMACLMHDAHESVVGDISSPIKWIVDGARTFEDEVAQAFWGAYGISEIMYRCEVQVKVCDLHALATEKHFLLPDSPPWAVLDGIEPVPGIALSPTNYGVPEFWAGAFVGTYNEIKEMLKGK